MRRLLNILFLIPVLYMASAPFYLKGRLASQPFAGLNVIVTDSLLNRFVSAGEVRLKLDGGSVLYEGRTMREIDLSGVETLVASSLAGLKSSEAFVTIDGRLHVEVDQRNPVLRIRTRTGSEYYIDDEGYVIRKRGLYPPRIHVAGGNISIPDFSSEVRHVDDAAMPALLPDLYRLVQYVRSAPVLSALIDQFEVDGRGDFVLVPRTGGHRIVFGDIADMEDKFATLEAFYAQVMKQGMWDSYSEINLKYEGQVVCRKK